MREAFEYEEARECFERALAMRPGAPEVLFQLGSLALSQGNAEEARGILAPLVKEWPEFVEAHVSLTQAYFRLGQRDDARRHQAIVRELNARAQERDVIRSPRPEVGEREGGGAP
jgi:predicted Zn-dependent protease